MELAPSLAALCHEDVTALRTELASERQRLDVLNTEHMKLLAETEVFCHMEANSLTTWGPSLEIRNVDSCKHNFANI